MSGHRCAIVGAAIAATLVTACGSSAPTPVTPAPGPPPSCEYYDYRFELDDSLRLLTATVCFDGAPPPALICGPQGDPEYAPRAELISTERPLALPTDACRIALDGVSAGDCIRYTVDLGELAPAFPLSLVATNEHLVTAQTGAFLFRPEARAATLHAHATFTLPAGAVASLPWEPDADGYLLDATAFERIGYAAFGQFEQQTIEVDGVTLRVAMVGAMAPATRAAVAPWMTRIVSTTSQLGGAFPATRAQVLLVPRPGSGGVSFGMVGRGGGASIVLVLAGESTERELIDSWEPVHELVHLRTAYVSPAGRWLTEGIATYYQEVLRARDGLVTPQHAWKRLVTGLSRGSQVGTGGTLREETTRMHTSGAYQRVYWAGAAIALMADVELRERSHGTRSLDSVVLELQTCCTRQARTLTGSELIERLDELAGEAVFTRLAAQHLDRVEFPDLTSTFARLGVVTMNDDVELDPNAPLAATRDAIMGPVPRLTAAR